VTEMRSKIVSRNEKDTESRINYNDQVESTERSTADVNENPYMYYKHTMQHVDTVV
jgi:hypothetical protein